MTRDLEDAKERWLTPSRLRTIGLFGGIAQSTLESLCEALSLTEVQPGERVVQEGEAARSLYVVLDGELEVQKRAAPAGPDVRVALLGPDDWFGEMSLLDVQPRSATVTCVAPAVLLRITHQEVDRLLYRADLKSYTLLLMNIARELSRRLRVADGILVQVQTALATEYHRGSGAR